MSENKGDKKLFLTPVGAMIALICFFLPWIKISCSRLTKSFSGPQIGGIFWLILVYALVIMVAFFYFRKRNQVEKTTPVVILSSILVLAVILIKSLSLLWGHKSQWVKIGSKAIDVTVQAGAVGVIVGFLLAIVGSVFTKRGDNNQEK